MTTQTTPKAPVIIAGGGIGGLSMALTFHQIGIPCVVLESVPELKPLGVGINLQPNAVRELYEMGIGDDQLDTIGLKTKEWALVGLNGKDVYSEPRGVEAGYKWPQYSVHRGELQMLLYREVVAKMGPEAILTGHKVTGYRNHADGSGVTAMVSTRDGQQFEMHGAFLVGADGLHSAIRAQMHPDQPPIHWGGAVMWRGTSPGKPMRTEASFIGLGTHHHRIVFYPISPADPETGLATINWIAEVTFDNVNGWGDGDWNKKVELNHFIHHFDDWDFDWMDVPALIRDATEVYEYPMVDRDPIPTWVDGNVVLMGDAAHVMYPTGSNGASQAIVDARVLGASFVKHGFNVNAIQAYDRKMCPEISEVVLRNRGAGPFRLLNILDERCGGVFDDIESVFPATEREEVMSNYKMAAGYAIEKLNDAPPTILPEAKVVVSEE